MSLHPPIYPFFKGRVALHAILQAAGIGEGDQVLLPGYTCVVVPNAIMYAGAEPVYLDIETNTYNIDCEKLEADLGTTWDPDRTRAIIVQHTYGIPCDMDSIANFASRHGLLIIEDACHALGSTWRGNPVGSFGDASFFSSQWSKPVTTGLGGWAQINSPELQIKLEAVLPQYGQPKTIEALQLEIQYIAFNLLNHPRLFWIIQGIYRTLGNLGLAIGSSTSAELNCELPVDYKKGMHSIQQRRLANLLTHMTRSIEKRRANTQFIQMTLEEKGIPTVVVPDGSDPVFLRYPVMVENKSAVLAEAKKKRIQLGDWFLSPVHPNLNNWELSGYKPGRCPVAEFASQRVINIPTGPKINSSEIRRTIEFIATYGKGVTTG